MRMIDSKVSTSKDIDEFDRTDVNNFLTSFGLKNFTTSATRDEFMNQEQYLKRIIKNYGALKQQKGSRDVIDTILNIFNYGDRSVDVNKYMLYESEFEKAPEEIKNKDAAKSKKSKLLKNSNLAPNNKAFQDVSASPFSAQIALIAQRFRRFFLRARAVQIFHAFPCRKGAFP